MKLKSAWSSTRSGVKKVSKKSASLLRFFLKQIQLQILPELTKWKRAQEQAKVAIYKDRGFALLNTIPHLIPLGGALALIVLNTNTLVFGNLSTSAVAAFQFAAKLLELTVQASLGAMLLNVVRRQIVKNRDLPLGCLLAPLRAIDVSYLWSLEFWGSLTTNRWLWRRKLLLLPLVFLTVV